MVLLSILLLIHKAMTIGLIFCNHTNVLDFKKSLFANIAQAFSWLDESVEVDL